MVMKNALLVLAGTVVGIAGVFGWNGWMERQRMTKVTIPTEVQKPLLKYTIENLGKREYGSQIVLDEITATQSAGVDSGFVVQRFHYDSDGKKVTGLAHIPDKCVTEEKCPIILQFRGYAEREKYMSGYGTWRSAQEYAKVGFISLAPDFLGYGGSASPSADVFEARFETYTTALNLLDAAEIWGRGNGRVGIWGHSNGGQISLTVLEVSGKDYPTTLWAPVSAGFPYSILFFMDTNDSSDRELRRSLARFEDMYDASLYNPLNYLERVQGELQIHQGTADTSVPVGWTDKMVASLRKMGKSAHYFRYVGADHNLVPDWNEVVRRDIEFFKEKLELTVE